MAVPLRRIRPFPVLLARGQLNVATARPRVDSVGRRARGHRTARSAQALATVTLGRDRFGGLGSPQANRARAEGNAPLMGTGSHASRPRRGVPVERRLVPPAGAVGVLACPAFDFEPLTRMVAAPRSAEQGEIPTRLGLVVESFGPLRALVATRGQTRGPVLPSQHAMSQPTVSTHQQDWEVVCEGPNETASTSDLHTSSRCFRRLASNPS